MLPSPIASGLGLLDPHGLISRRGSLRLMLRPAAPFLLALPPGSRPTAEDSLPSSSGGLPGWDFHPRLTSPCWTHMPIELGRVISMSESRSLEQRRSDVQDALARNGDAWLATASPSARPHLIAVSSWWDGSHVVVATTGASRTARNLAATRRGRLALGSPDDVVMVDVTVAGSVA